MSRETAQKLHAKNNWLFHPPGDLGLIDDHGYVQSVGRGKDLIISGGYNIPLLSKKSTGA